MRKTKIVCTMGPATENEKVLNQLMLSGMDAARFNFSHGTYEWHKSMFDKVVRCREKLALNIPTILDTKGPEIRIGSLAGGSVTLKKGQSVVFTTQNVEGNDSLLPISYAGLPKDVGRGDRILIDDGLIETRVEEVRDTEIVCRVHNGGKVSDHKGVNVPGAALSMPYISEKDRKDIEFAADTGFDFIAASFVRSAEDVMDIRRVLAEKKCNTINIIAKIENRQGVENIDKIIAVSDGIMVARGDMGVEIPFEEVPILQKKLITKGYNAGKQVITATQMLESMIHNPRPTRAEATDVANAIYDGTSAIMLSGETAMGDYPVEAVETMARIARCTEKDIDYRKRFRSREVEASPDITNAISHATCTTAHDLGASAVITVTMAGKTARMISKYRPACRIIGCTTQAHVCRQLNLSWGVTPLLIEEASSTDELFNLAVDGAERSGLVKPGELVVITAGVPLRVSGTTNLMKVHVAGHVLLRGTGIGSKRIGGNLCVVQNQKSLESFCDGDIIVARSTDNTMLPYLKKARAIICESPTVDCHASTVGLSLDIPVIINAENATKILKSGAYVLVDAESGTVSYTA
ncbi:MAG: pyruvate kinase [Firmicutes bacterium]|nr:pyruvate kinase [Bacillota bacterium]